ncbi:MAG: hypothetical protein H8E80_07780 [Desulfobacteraceae bacterium]|uniref:Outer membrane lipoprotein-sorting protein n=1 Tax=Candidatus Desulfaltia bathyphila TaxID=2841697 RepID=A0A8J6N6F5_9BACT|nr:hypothetical protein [Candidatus Desulfaltia bathyphila]
MYNYLRLLKNAFVILFCLAMVLCCYTPANCYVLQGPHLLDLMIKKYGNAKKLLVSQNLIFYDNIRQMGAVEINETLSYVFPEEFRSDILSENTQKIHVVSKDRTLTIIDGKIADDFQSVFDIYKDLILYRSRILLQKRLDMLGVDGSIASLGRFRGKIVYIVGAQYPDESASQVWIDKDTFRPIRWIISKKAGNGRQDAIEFRYVQWKMFDNNWYPIRIEIYQDDTLLREIVVDNIDTTPSFSEDFFNIKKLQSTYMEAGPGKQEQSDQEGLSEIQKTIEEFKKIYR